MRAGVRCGNKSERRKRNSFKQQWQIGVQNNNIQFMPPLQYNFMRNLISSKQKIYRPCFSYYFSFFSTKAYRQTGKHMHNCTEIQGRVKKKKKQRAER